MPLEELMNAIELLNELSAKTNEFAESVKEKEQSSQSRNSLVKVLEEFSARTDSLNELLSALSAECSKESLDISAERPKQELNELSTFLKRNLQFEREKLLRTTPFNEIAEKQEIPQVYNAIEEKAKKALLGLAYFAEKALISMHSEKKQFSGSAQAQAVLQMLKAKDNELEGLKKKYNSLMAKGLLARVEEQTSADFEETLNQTARNLEVSSSELQKTAIENRGTIEKAVKNQAVLEQKVRESDELLSKFLSHALETITVLKKERDSARKFALDLEHETTALRQTYSKELLGLQEHKMQLQKQFQDEFVKKTRGLEIELRQKTEYLEHFKKLVDEKDAELNSLREKLEKHKQVLQHYAVHDKMKKRHGKKAGK